MIDRDISKMTNEERHQMYRENAEASRVDQPEKEKKKRGFVSRMREKAASLDAQRALAQDNTVFVMATSNAIQWPRERACQAWPSRLRPSRPLVGDSTRAPTYSTLPVWVTRCGGSTPSAEMS